MTNIDTNRIRVANSILASLSDIRPEYRARIVTQVEEGTESSTVLLTLNDGYRVKLTGLYARVILGAGEENGGN